MYVAFEENLRKVSGATRLFLQGNVHPVTDLIQNVTDDVINTHSALHGRTLGHSSSTQLCALQMKALSLVIPTFGQSWKYVTTVAAMSRPLSTKLPTEPASEFGRNETLQSIRTC